MRELRYLTFLVLATAVAVWGQDTNPPGAQKSPVEVSRPAPTEGVAAGGMHAASLDVKKRPITAGGPVKSGPTVEILGRDQAEKIMPATVFFRGQTATTQGRNSAGLRVTGGKLVLAALVDSSGYSSGIAERYQAYLISEVYLRVDGKVLAPGSYAFGFLSGDHMVVMDVGGNEIADVRTIRQEGMKRPVPLQIVADNGEYRLYLGRTYVTLLPEENK